MASLYLLITLLLLVHLNIFFAAPVRDFPKILLLITSNGQSYHQKMLLYCWPKIIHLDIFKHADALIYYATNHNITNHKAIYERMFKNNVTFIFDRNHGYQKGAVVPMKRGLNEGWFLGYDWIVRINPDVIINNDTFLVSNMHDSRVHGIFTDCFSRCKNKVSCGLVHTDFIAFRPRYAGPVFKGTFSTAERYATSQFMPVIQSGHAVWLPYTTQQGICRVTGKMSFVVHAHSCPIL